MMTSLSWFSSFNPKVLASALKYYLYVGKTSCELMKEKMCCKMYTVRRIGYAAAVIRNYLKDLLVLTVDIGKTVRADAPDLCP